MIRCPTCGGRVHAIATDGPESHQLRPCGHTASDLTLCGLREEPERELVADGGITPTQERAIAAIQENRDLGALDPEARRIAEEVRRKRTEEMQRAVEAVAWEASRQEVA